MTTDKPTLIDTVLEIRAVGKLQDVSEDLMLEDGKSISELLQNEKEKNETAPPSQRE